MEREKKESLEMAVAAGGSIQQVIVRDRHSDDHWEPTRMVMFNLQLLNASTFESLGISIPSTPVTAETYALYGYPFFDLEEQKSGIAGNFPLNTVAQLDKTNNQNETLHEAESGLDFPSIKIGGETSQDAEEEDAETEDDMDVDDYDEEEGDCDTDGDYDGFEESILDDGDSSTASDSLPSFAIKLNTTDERSLFLPIRLLEQYGL